MVNASVDVVEIATQVVEAVGTIVSAYSSAELLEVARDNYELWRSQREYYYSVFQEGVERPLAAEVFNTPRDTLDYSSQAATIYDTSTGVLGGQAGSPSGWWDRHAAMYNTVRDEVITELAPDLARLQSDWANYLFRYEEHTVDIHNDIRWDRRLALHNVGIKQGTAISAALATSFKVYEDAIDGVGDEAASIANGAAIYAGYRQGRADTYSDFAEYGYARNKRQASVNISAQSSPQSELVGPR